MNQPTANSTSILKNFHIPAQPDALLAFTKEASKESYSLDLLANILKQDPSLLAALLQLVNSPLFAISTTITSPHQAISLLGLKRSLSLVRTVAIRSSIDTPLELPRFWDTATETAHLCERISELLTGANSEHAYSLGLFHNCGIPLMIQAFDDYLDVLREANHSLQPLTWLENDRYNLTHCRLGSEMAKNWNLPKAIHQAILLDPVYEDVLENKIETEKSVDTLLAILHAAKNISSHFRKPWRVYDSSADQKLSPLILKSLDISEDAFHDLHDQLLAELTAALAENA
jgi:HD-like signal output (HDOD) protein